MTIDSGVGQAIDDLVMQGAPLRGISTERIQDELLKMFRSDSAKSVWVLTRYDLLVSLLAGRLWLKATLEAQ